MVDTSSDSLLSYLKRGSWTTKSGLIRFHSFLAVDTENTDTRLSLAHVEQATYKYLLSALPDEARCKFYTVSNQCSSGEKAG
jgi:hypothetical protein